MTIDGWRAETVRDIPVWTADVSALLRAHGPFPSLFVNSERRPRPRLPKEGYWRIESVPGRSLGGDHWKTLFDGSDAFVAEPGTVEHWRNLADVEAVVLHFSVEERLPVAGFDPTTRPRPDRPQDPHGARGRERRHLPAILGRERLRGPRPGRVKVPRPPVGEGLGGLNPVSREGVASLVHERHEGPGAGPDEARGGIEAGDREALLDPEVEDDRLDVSDGWPGLRLCPGSATKG